MRSRALAAGLSVFAGLAAPAAATPPPAYNVTLTGSAGDGTWQLALDRTPIDGDPAACLWLEFTAADGLGGNQESCAIGSLKPVNGLMAQSLHISGDADIYVTAGVAPAKAKSVCARTAGSAAPAVLPVHDSARLLGVRVRWFGGEVGGRVEKIRAHRRSRCRGRVLASEPRAAQPSRASAR